jgi:hypothetical protein
MLIKICLRQFIFVFLFRLIFFFLTVILLFFFIKFLSLLFIYFKILLFILFLFLIVLFCNCIHMITLSYLTKYLTWHTCYYILSILLTIFAIVLYLLII